MIVLAASAVALGGCLPMLAANVAEVAVGAARGHPKNNEGAGSEATMACTAQAQRYGPVHIIDTEQHTSSQIIVWGTAGDGADRKSFKCTYGTKLTSFSVRAIPAPH